MIGVLDMNPKISVIMPMYNVEKYIGCAVRSLLNQTFTDFEAILVDDCSTDNTLEIAKSFDDPRIKIFKNKNNLGAGNTRNRGVSLASGEYIYFFDSDDALLPNALEILFDAACKTESDVITSTVYLLSNDREFQTLQNLDCRAIRAGTMKAVSDDLKVRIWEEYAMHNTHCAPWLNLYKRAIFGGISSNARGGGILCRNLAVAIDDAFLFDLLCETSKITKIDAKFYVYREREGSLSNSSDFNRLKKYIPTIMEFARFINKKLMKLTNDQFFADNVVYMVIGRLVKLRVIPYFVKDRVVVSQLLTEILRPTFKENTAFVKNMIVASMLGEIASSQLQLENEKLKNKIKEIFSSE